MPKISIRRMHFMYSYDKFIPRDLTFQVHHYYEILFFVSGNAKFIINGDEYSASPGDVFITAPGEIHSIVFKGNEIYERHFIQFDTEFLSMLSPSLPERMSGAAQNHKIANADAEKYRLDELFYSIRQCAEEKKSEYEVLIQSYILQMLVAVCECTSRAIAPPERSSKKTMKIKEYIRHNFTRALTLDEIAENAFFNKFYMCHIFKEETGMTIKEYIEMMRFMYARRLHFQGKKLADIAALCGYSDYSMFYKSFVRYSGMSPSEFFSLDEHDDKSAPMHKDKEQSV